MSTPLGTNFGGDNSEAYAAVVQKWGTRLKGVDKITPDMRKEWGADLEKALGDSLHQALLNEAAPTWKKVGALPDQDTLDRFAKIAVKASLSKDHGDLLDRLRLMAQEPIPEDAVTAAITVSEAVKRAGQTLSQIVDMVKDKFNRTMDNYYQRKGDITGRRRWRTVSASSRHSALEGQEKGPGELFYYKGLGVYGPRPPGGSPASWSNCSCYLAFEKADGSWDRIR